MNLVKIQNELKNVPDHALIGYVQNPSGQVPTYLALSELERRKEMRSKYNAQKAPDKSVAEGIVEEAQPGLTGLPQAQSMMQAMQPPPEMPTQQMAQGGLADLAMDNDMFNEENFATGGIVAFDDGGEVATSKFGDFFRGLGNPAALETSKQIGALEAEKNRLKFSIFTPKTPTEKAADMQRIQEIDAQISDLSTKKLSTPAVPAAPAIPTATSAVPGGPRVDATQLPSSFTGIGSPSQLGVSPSAVNQMSPPPAAPVAKASGPDFGGLYQPIPDRSAEFASLYQDPTGAAQAGMDKYKALLGEDLMRPKLEEKLTKMEERANKSEEQAPWMALAKAGFGMAAGKSRYAMQNIAEGAGMGLEDYAKSKDRLETLRDKQFDLQARLSQAQRAEQIAAATYGLKDEDTMKAQNHTDKVAKLNYENQRDAANQKNKIDAFEAVNKGKLYGAQAEYYGQKGPTGNMTEKDLFDKYITGGGEMTLGPWEEFRKKYMGMPTDINNLVNKYNPKK